MTTSGITSGNEWQRTAASDTTNDKEWQRVITSDNEWQRVTTSDREWYNEWQRVVHRTKANESEFRFQNETIMHNVKLQYIQQCLFENILQSRTSAEAATESVL